MGELEKEMIANGAKSCETSATTIEVQKKRVKDERPDIVKNSREEKKWI